MEDGPRAPKKKNMSVKKYASAVFAESSFTAIAAIVSTRSVPRKVFRTLVFLTFAVGFGYQIAMFLKLVLEYPTVVNIEVVEPRVYLMPAFTYCSTNPGQRSQFCDKHPESCEAPGEAVCSRYPHFCGDRRNMVIKQSVLKNLQLTAKEVLDLNPHPEDLVSISLKNKNIDPPTKGRVQDKEGKTTINRFDLGESRNYSEYIICYTHNDRSNNSLYPEMVPVDTSVSGDSSSYNFVFDANEEDMIDPNIHPGILFRVHSPFERVNPGIDGILLSPGKIYKIQLSMEEESKLPYPYQTDCLNYSDQWEKKGRSGPRSKSLCIHKCHTNTRASLEKDVDANINSKSEENLDAINSLLQPLILERVDCIMGCKEECLRVKFKSVIQERYITPEWINDQVTKSSRQIRVDIQMDESEIIRVNFQPKFETVEVFSYIGGFIGIWLGVSLVEVVDLLESLVRIGRYYYRKGTCSSKQDDAVEL